LPELKAEIQDRADRKVYPVSQLDAAKVRLDLARCDQRQQRHYRKSRHQGR